MIPFPTKHEAASTAIGIFACLIGLSILGYKPTTAGWAILTTQLMFIIIQIRYVIGRGRI